MDYIKSEGTTDAYKKSRVVAQEYNSMHLEFMTHAPTVKRVSQRMLLCIATSDTAMHTRFRDVNQAYTQAKTILQQPVVIRPSKVLG